MTDIERCDKEIAEAEAMLRAGHRDMEGLLLQLMDWSIERRLLSGRGTLLQPDGKRGGRTEATWV
ncbi:MAG TPA: hypothetical protein VKJ01_12000 [Candidatus Solibacter sp.]|jgi:hypothetical protein|nr:hypothetical protein [Candidatus Solibacter sp.]